LIIPFQDYREFSSNYIFPIILKNGTKEKRDILRHQLANAGIQTSVHYPAVHRFNIYQQFNYSLQKTDYVTNCLITLPMYSSLPIDKVEFISNEIFGSL